MEDYKPHLHPNMARYTADELEYILLRLKAYGDCCRNLAGKAYLTTDSRQHYQEVAEHTHRILTPQAYEEWQKGAGF